MKKFLWTVKSMKKWSTWQSCVFSTAFYRYIICSILVSGCEVTGKTQHVKNIVKFKKNCSRSGWIYLFTIGTVSNKIHSCSTFLSIFSVVAEIPNKKHGLYIFIHIQTHSSHSFHSFVRRGHTCMFESTVQQKVAAFLWNQLKNIDLKADDTLCYYHRPMPAAQRADEPLHACCHLKKKCIGCSVCLVLLCKFFS